MPTRPPVVTMMGHIDHGKTSLLDKIRSSHTWQKEIGGITQHVSVYQVEIGKTGKKITFIDTPGHAAFKKMRSRGGQVTDIVVLVVSATDGVMAQTKECINLIKQLDLPLIVALNKTDLPSSSPDMVKGQLAECDLLPEEYGGQVSCIPVSAKTGQGIDKLLDTILLTAEILDLQSQPNLPLQAYIIESKIDPHQGNIATAIVKQGQLKIGDDFYLGQTKSKVKAMFDYQSKPINLALPSTPVTILGFTSLPSVGQMITSLPTDDFVSVPTSSSVSADTTSQTPKLPVVVKADTQGTLEALLASFSDDVQIISSGVGPVTDNDIFLASSANAQVLAFNLKVTPVIQNLAKSEKVSILSSSIIYEILEEIEKQVLKLLEPTIDETILGEGKIIAEFKIDKVRIAGLKCTKGVIKKSDQIHLVRLAKIIKDTKVDNIRQAKVDVDQIKLGNDCGITFKPYVDFKIGDVIISYIKEK